jgi:hypothetical protein
MKHSKKVSPLSGILMSLSNYVSLLMLVLPMYASPQSPVLDWALTAGEAGYSTVYSVRKDASGNKYVLGDFEGTVDFDPGPAQDKKRSTKTEKIFLTKFDQTNNYLWTKRLGGIELNGGSSLHIDAGGDLYIATTFISNTDFDPSALTQTLSSNGDKDAALLKVNSNGNYLWCRRVGGAGEDFGTSITTDTSGNIYFLGDFSSVANCDPGGSPTYITSSGGLDVFMIKYSSSGSLIWTKSFGGKKDDNINGATSDQSGKIILTGGFRDTCDFDPGINTYTLASTDPLNLGSDAIFVVKFDQLGSLIWAKQYSGDGPEWGQSVVSDKNDDILVTGSFGSSGLNFGTGTISLGGSTDVFTLKLDGNGVTAWAFSFGDIYSDYGHSVCVDDSDNVYCSGYFIGNVDFDPATPVASHTASNVCAYVAKYSPAGSYMWSKQVTGNSKAMDVSFHSNELLGGGNFYWEADMDPGPSVFKLNGSVNNVAYFLSLDRHGNFNTAKHFYSEWGVTYYTDMKVDASGNCYNSGYMSGMFDVDPSPAVNTLTVGTPGFWPQVPVLSKYDASGNLVWIKALQGRKNTISYAFSNVLDASGNIYISGIFTDTLDFDPGASSFTLSSKGNFDLFVAKYDNSGNFLWAKSTGGSNEDRAQTMTLDASGNLYLSGFFAGTVDFDFSSGVQNLTSADPYRSMFIAKYDNQGNYIWAKCIGSAGGWAHPYSIAIDAGNDLILAGSFDSAVDFDPGSSVFSLTDNGAKDIFIAKYTSAGNFLWVKGIGGSSQDECFSVTTDASNNIYSTGYFDGVVDFDPSAVVQTLTGTYMDAYLQKMDPNGNYIWAKSFGGKQMEAGRSVEINSAGELLMGGYTTDTLDLDPGSGTDIYYPENYKGFISKLDNSGNYIWGRVFEGRGWSSDITRTLYSGSGIIACGYLQLDADLDVNTGVFEVSSAMPVGFVTRFNECDISEVTSVSASTNTLCTPAPVNLSLTGGNLNSAAYWQWYEGSCGSNPVGTGTLLTVTPTITTTYYLSGAGGCAGAAAGCSGVTIVVGQCVGISEDPLTETGISIFPNPFNDSFTIALRSGEEEYTVEIFSASGGLVYQERIKNRTNIDMSEKSSGIYLVRIRNSESSFSKKVIKH